MPLLVLWKAQELDCGMHSPDLNGTEVASGKVV